MMKVTRSGTVAAVAALMMLLAIPLWQLSSHADAGYYTQRAKDFFFKNAEKVDSAVDRVVDKVRPYLGPLTHEQEVYNNTLYMNSTAGEVLPYYNFSTPCDSFPNTDGILLVMKTGATEMYQKMPTQLLTAMACLPDFLLFSDIESQIGKYHFSDALDRVEETIRKQHREWVLYEAQQQCPISLKECTDGLSGGWDLDKYKFLNMIERTWDKRPNMDWYVFAEADTYIVWPNLVQWLRERAPEGDQYVGSVAMLKDFPFAHGGSGYVVSGSLVKKMVEKTPGIGAKYDAMAQGECCGDYVLSRAVDDAGTRVKQAHPMFNGEKPNTLPYGPGHWCEPIFTMHHVNSEEISMLWQYEQTRTNKTENLVIRDLYFAFMAPYLIDERDEWDNMSDDKCYLSPDEQAQNDAGGKEKERQKPEEEKNGLEKRAHESPSACALVCEGAGLDLDYDELEKMESDEKRSEFIHERYLQKVAEDEDGHFRRDRSCFQWRYQKGACCTSNRIKFGATKREDNDDDRWTSGWFVDGINDWIDERGDCEAVEWKEPA